jgi:nucleoside-diphosphate-sugar epimerase
MKEQVEKLHPSLQNWPYRKVFLTGATGLVGGQLLHDLLQLPHVEELVCLVRPAHGLSGQERLSQKLKRAGVKGKALDEAMSRVRAAEGSVDVALWGLGESVLSWIRNECELFIHCAASISFSDGVTNEAINVNGTRNMIEVLRGAKSIKLFVPFSTATLCGWAPNEVVKEEESLARTHHIIAYTITKSKAEKMLRAAAAELPPMFFVRPCGVMAYGSRDRKQAKLFLWSLIAIAQLPFVRLRRDSLMDIVTVDFVVKCTLLLIAKFPNLKYDCYHLTGSVEKSATCGEIFDVACAKSTRAALPKVIPPAEWTTAHEKSLAEQGFGEIWESLQVYLPFMEMNCVYDNTRLKEELGADLPNLPKFTDYMNEMFAMIDPNLVTNVVDEASAL